jgi:hypothetical protein
MDTTPQRSSAGCEIAFYIVCPFLRLLEHSLRHRLVGGGELFGGKTRIDVFGALLQTGFSAGRRATGQVPLQTKIGTAP